VFRWTAYAVALVSQTTFGDGEVCGSVRSAPAPYRRVVATATIHLAMHPEGMDPGCVSGSLVEPRRG
jgi:hypothetical protein